MGRQLHRDLCQKAPQARAAERLYLQSCAVLLRDPEVRQGARPAAGCGVQRYLLSPRLQDHADEDLLRARRVPAPAVAEGELPYTAAAQEAHLRAEPDQLRQLRTVCHEAIPRGCEEQKADRHTPPRDRVHRQCRRPRLDHREAHGAHGRRIENNE